MGTRRYDQPGGEPTFTGSENWGEGAAGGGPGTTLGSRNGPPGLDGDSGDDGFPGPPASLLSQPTPLGLLGSLNGPPGNDGESGEDGLPGARGATGATGAAGAAGATGSAGPPGEDGQDAEAVGGPSWASPNQTWWQFGGSVPLYVRPQKPSPDDEECESFQGLPNFVYRNLTTGAALVQASPPGVAVGRVLTTANEFAASIDASWRKSWAMFQFSNGGGAGVYQICIGKAVTIPTARTYWARIGCPTRVGGDGAADSNWGIIICDQAAGIPNPLAGNSVLLYIETPVANQHVLRFGKVTAGVFAGIGDLVINLVTTGIGPLIEYIGIRKSGNNYDAYMFTEGSSRIWLGTTTHNAAMTFEGLYNRSGGAGTNGDAIYGFDFTRNLDDNNLFPC